MVRAPPQPEDNFVTISAHEVSIALPSGNATLMLTPQFLQLQACPHVQLLGPLQLHFEPQSQAILG